MSEREYVVSGMHCGHCVAAVTEEVSGVPGVESVQVSLEGGRVVVTGDGFTDEQVRDAVLEAGYAVGGLPLL